MSERKRIELDPSFTTTKRADGFYLRQAEFAQRGHRNEQVKAGIYVELNRSIEFKPSEFLDSLKKLRLTGWTVEEIEGLRVELIGQLVDRSKNGQSSIIAYEERKRPEAQIKLEKELQREREASRIKDDQMEELRAKLQSFEATPPSKAPENSHAKDFQRRGN